ETLRTVRERCDQLRIDLLSPRVGRHERGARGQSAAHVSGEPDDARQLPPRSAAVREGLGRDCGPLIDAGAAANLDASLARQASRIEPRRRWITDARNVGAALEPTEGTNRHVVVVRQHDVGWHGCHLIDTLCAQRHPTRDPTRGSNDGEADKCPACHSSQRSGYESRRTSHRRPPSAAGTPGFKLSMTYRFMHPVTTNSTSLSAI